MKNIKLTPSSYQSSIKSIRINSDINFYYHVSHISFHSIETCAWNNGCIIESTEGIGSVKKIKFKKVW